MSSDEDQSVEGTPKDGVFLPMNPPDKICPRREAGRAESLPAPRVPEGTSVAEVYKHHGAGAAGSVTMTPIEDILHYQEDAAVVSPMTGLPMPKVARGVDISTVYGFFGMGGSWDPNERLNHMSTSEPEDTPVSHDDTQYVQTRVASATNAKPEVRRFGVVKKPLW